MNLQAEPTTPPDSAAVFACAMSLWEACTTHAAMKDSIVLSELFNGMDQLMREVMRIANLFEEWSCRHIDFCEWETVWPYFLQEQFGISCLKVTLLHELPLFDERDCLRVAIELRLPIKLTADLRVPVSVSVRLADSGPAFHELRIQTVRDSLDGDNTVRFTSNDDPFDEEFGEPYFAVYGVDKDGLLEHISDRKTYADAVSLVEKLSPAARCPVTPAVGD